MAVQQFEFKITPLSTMAGASEYRMWFPNPWGSYDMCKGRTVAEVLAHAARLAEDYKTGEAENVMG